MKAPWWQYEGVLNNDIHKIPPTWNGAFILLFSWKELKVLLEALCSKENTYESDL